MKVKIEINRNECYLIIRAIETYIPFIDEHDEDKYKFKDLLVNLKEVKDIELVEYQ